jgi:hypothetical protein
MVDEPYRDVCAVGRRISRNDSLGGKDWQTPCPVPPTERLRMTAYEYTLCEPHHSVIITHMLENEGQVRTIFQSPDQHTEIVFTWNSEKDAYICPCGTEISPYSADHGRLMKEDFGLVVAEHMQLTDHRPYFKAR